jgi:hypothetical protein
VPIGDEPMREPILKRMFFGNSNHTKREEKILEYIIHRMSKGTRLHDVIQEDYVRRNCSQGEVHELINDPELVHACRKHLWQTFRAGELDPRQGHLRSQLSADGSPADGRDVSDSSSLGT